ncbi:MAG TPA: extracellular solute-binding protein [Candidatus Mediterraneibacter intestinipullorum]|nr:extracellular solute-binding protein [Candidatus Mediterraneibacter intestinipullorum]
MKKKIAAALAMVMAFSLAACSGGGGTDTPSTSNGEQENVTLRFYNYALSETAKADWWNATVEAFEAENDWIDIETVTVDYNSMIQTFTNDLASGLAVDMVYGEVSWIPALAESGFVQSPEDVLSSDFYSGYYDYVLEQMKYNDTVYAVPHYYSPSLIFVNKELVEAAGLSMDSFPTTLDGLKEWIETLAAYYQGDANVTTVFGLTTAEVSATGANINAMYNAFGGTLIDDQGGLADLTSGDNLTAMTEMLDFYKYLIGNGYTQENLKLKDYRSSFGAGNVVMYVDQSWGYAQISEVSDSTSDFTVTASLPGTMGTNGKGESLVESHCFMIGSSLSDTQKEAVDLFIQYCTSTGTMEDYLNNIGLAYVAHENMEDCQISPILDGASAGKDNVVTQPLISAATSVQTEMASMVLNYVSNGVSPEDVINSYITEAEYYINQ